MILAILIISIFNMGLLILTFGGLAITDNNLKKNDGGIN